MGHTHMHTHSCAHGMQPLPSLCLSSLHFFTSLLLLFLILPPQSVSFSSQTFVLSSFCPSIFSSVSPSFSHPSLSFILSLSATQDANAAPVVARQLPRKHSALLMERAHRVPSSTQTVPAERSERRKHQAERVKQPPDEYNREVCAESEG